MYLKGLGRKNILSNAALSIPGSTALVSGDYGQFARFTGLYSGTGSVTIRYRFGLDNANYLTSSAFVVNSGPGTFDILNLGEAVEFAVTAANSQVAAILITGEPIR